MAKNNSKKSLWECKHGCKLTKTPCKHLERKLADPNKGRLTRAYIEENISGVLDLIKEPVRSDLPLTRALYEYGLQEYEVELLLDRYVAGLSLREISKRHGYIKHQTVGRLMSDLVKKLRKSPQFKLVLKNLLKGVDNE